jgi:hypothetical protein
MVLERISEDTIMRMPDFIHRLPSFHGLEDPRSHSTGRFLRLHIAIDRIFYRIRQFLNSHDAMPGYDLLNAALGLLWGFNCRFPPRDVALHTAWYLRGCPAYSIWELKESVWKRVVWRKV